MNLFRFLSFLYLYFLVNLLSAQQFGGFSPSKKWKQLNHENYRIIYSPSSDSIARKTAAILTTMNAIEQNIGVKRRKIDIVLQNSTTIANGYVGLAPYVSEFFLTPLPINSAIGTLPWHYTLAVHEYQHVLQFANAYYGVSKIAHWLAGENGWALSQFLSIPNWFFEGNAVMAETDFTEQGRGRIPSFFNEFRAYTQQNSFPSYDKLRNGSIQDLLPDQYPLGYLMVHYGKKQFGDQYWTNVLKEASAYRGIVYPFSKALKKEGGEYAHRFYQNMTEELHEQWKVKVNRLGDSIYPFKKQEVVNYEFPTLDNDSSLYFYKGSFDMPGAIYQVKANKLIKHHTLGIRSSNYFDVYNGKILSTQINFDKRWAWVDYQNIVVYDTKTKKLKQLTKKGKYFHPAFSKDGSQILALYATPSSTYELHLLSSETGEIIQKIANPNQHYFTYISSTSTGNFVTSARNNLGQMAIVEISPDGTFHQLTDWSYHILGRVSETDGAYYFNTTYEGTDNLYLLSDSLLYQLSNDGPGRYSPLFDPIKDSLYFTAFSLNGFQLKRVKYTNLPKQLVKEITPLNRLPFYNKEYMKTTPKISTTNSLNNLIAQPYSKFDKLVNLHSWGVTTNDPEYGIELRSDNILNTLDLTAGYLYNTNENKGGYRLALDYGQFFLHLNANAERTERNIRTGENRSVRLNETNWSAGVSLPLNYSSNTYSRIVNLAANYQNISANFNNELINNFNINAANFRSLYRQSRIKARKNIFTHFGIYTELNRRVALNRQTKQLSLKNSIALGGLFANHNLIVDLDAQIEESDDGYLFSDRFTYGRGFRSIRFNNLYKVSSNYHLPIAYPDKGAFGIIYLQRIRSNLFFDFVTNSIGNNFSSTGAEVIFDLKFFRITSVSLGVRYAQVLSQKSFSENANQRNIELFIPINRF